MIALGIIERSRPRDKEQEREVLERAIAAGDWSTVDAIQMRDTLDAMSMHDPVLMPPRKPKNITHKQAILMAIELMEQRFGGGVSKAEIERDERGMFVLNPSKPGAAVKRPDPDKVAQIMSDRRNW
jgi:hypothetical protein